MPTDFGYTGQRLDGYIKLTQMGARWYDAQIGRWISPDTIIPDLASPPSLNRYSYVFNNPLLYIDPTGHDPEFMHDFDGSDPSPLAELWLHRILDNPGCPICSNATIPGILDEQWLEAHPGYSPDNDPFVAMVEQAFAEGAETFNGLTPADLEDLRRTYSLIRTGDEFARGEGRMKVLLKLLSELGLPLLGAVGQAHGKLGSEAQQMMATIPFEDAGLRQRVRNVLSNVDQGGPFPYRRDGIVFRNREGLLPDQPLGYYQEYTVSTPGAPGRGAQRLVVGQGGEVYFTPDHYQTFVRIR
jgi:ribonuclease T1